MHRSAVRRAVLALSLSLATLALPTVPAHETTHDGVALATASDTYPWPERPYERSVCFVFTNDVHVDLTLPSTAPWRIVDWEGTVAYAPDALHAQTRLAPGRSHAGCWRAHDSIADGYVPMEGTYAIEFRYAVGGAPRTITLDVTLART